MNKEQFMKELEYLLQDIPEEEKADALEYYRDYLEEAGEEEEKALQDFGSPERIAAIIRADIAGHLEDGGEFTEHGYEDTRFRDPNYQVAKRYDLPEAAQGAPAGNPGGKEQEDSRMNGEAKHRETSSGREIPWGKLLLAGVLLLIASPILLGIGGSLLGIVTALFGALAALVIGLGIFTLALLFGGLVCVGAGIAAAVNGTVGGVLAIGIGILILGIGFLLLALCVWFYGKILPWLFRVTVDGISNLFHRKGSRS